MTAEKPLAFVLSESIGVTFTVQDMKLKYSLIILYARLVKITFTFGIQILVGFSPLFYKLSAPVRSSL